MEKAAEELQEAERQEVEARREAVALQEQIEKMIQVIVKGHVRLGDPGMRQCIALQQLGVRQQA